MYWKLILKSSNLTHFCPTLTSLKTPDNQRYQIWHPNWVRLAPNGTNLEFLRSVSVHFGEPKCTETDLKNPKFVPFGANMTQFGCQIICHPWVKTRDQCMHLERGIECWFFYSIVTDNSPLLFSSSFVNHPLHSPESVTQTKSGLHWNDCLFCLLSM